MSRTILKEVPPPPSLPAPKHSSPLRESICFDWRELQELWDNGGKKVVRHYVKKHYLGSQAQTWLLRTKNISLIKTYLQNHPEAGLFDEAEEMLMALRDKDCCLLYINNRPLRHHSLLMLFAENEIELLQTHIAKHPQNPFSRLELILLFETKNLDLIQQYFQLHPEIAKDGNCKEKLKKFGLIHSN